MKNRIESMMPNDITGLERVKTGRPRKSKKYYIDGKFPLN
jgi:hypothetical protein